ncbi:MAG: OprO/OprP family phosphate-selective porin [Deltaproteobacteria bacterium]|nr:OprO/OprP family phosphate-selective porin [Deltaproteobacteria bacterium]MDL1962145.1 OprO/OprP family phosphate-selective porin [Deltaproteobacteria bacterium]
MNRFVRILFVFMVCIFWTGSPAWGGFKLGINDQSGVENHGVSQAKEYGREDPLIDILIHKGILTEEEAKEIQKEAVVLEEQRQQEVQEAAKEIKGKQPRGEIGCWTQVWYQYVEHGKKDGGDLNDFMARRFYLYMKGDITPYFSFFTHIAADRIGQEGLDRPSLGLGSGIAFRDLWITFKLNEALKIQAGRMYVPLTRNYGTTSTKCMLTTDLPFLQGGVRGNIFYAQKVGRDDSVTIWGNPLDGLIQYRFMVAEGVEGKKTDNNKVIYDNPDDNLRFAGRVAVSLLEPEKTWFNKGTYLGKKKVLSLGFGYDTQMDLTLNGHDDQDNRVWTSDVFFDHPLGEGAITVEAAYIDIQNCTQTHNFSELAAGDDAENWYIQSGYLLPGKVGPGRIQPYVKYETVDVDDKDDTDFMTAGLNYFAKGHNAKISLDYTYVDQESDREDQSIATFQLAVGF